MSGVVVVAGVFEPGSVVTLIQVPDERVLRPEGHDIIGQRLVDDGGNVGWDELEVGGRYFVTGYINGTYVLVRAIGVDAEAPDAQHLSQPPVQPTPQKIGTQEGDAPAETPALPDGHEALPTGIPAGLSTGVLEPPADVSTTEPLYLVDGGQVPATLVASDRQTPQEVTADGSTKPSELLFRPADGQPLDPIPEGIVRYEGPTVTADVEPTPVSSTPSSEPAAPAPDTVPPAAEPAPVQPDVPPVTEPVPSESAGTGDQAGAPSEQAAAPDAAPPEVSPAAPPTEAPADVTAAPDAAAPVSPAPTDGGAGPAAEAAPAPADQPPAPEAAPTVPEGTPPAAPDAPASPAAPAAGADQVAP